MRPFVSFFLCIEYVEMADGAITFPVGLYTFDLNSETYPSKN